MHRLELNGPQDQQVERSLEEIGGFRHRGCCQ
jgi:hypothetical protein